jgi:predicted RNase H-like nuclease (RuvC/YqgF family)
MIDDAELVEELRARMRELEDKIEALRISRRVLMNLLEDLEKEKREQLAILSSENEHLQRSNGRYARAIMLRDIRINQLEAKLRLLAGSQNQTGNTFT